MEITFLGTSAGVPTKNRNVSALALRPGQMSEWILFDCGEGTQHQLLKSSLSLYKLKQIFITHLHGDHIYGIFGLLASRGMINADSPLEIFAPEGIKELIETVSKITQLHLPYPLKIRELKGNEVLEFKEYKIEVVPLSHSITSYGYIFTERDKTGKFDIKKAKELNIPEGPLYGKLQKGESITLNGIEIKPSDVLGKPKRGKRVIIGGDNDKPELFLPYKDVDLMIHEATYTQSDFDKLPQKFKHTTAKQLGETAQKVGVKELIATHISPRYDNQNREKEILEEIKRYYKGEAKIAFDFMKVKI